MGIITLKVSEEEEKFLKSMAKLENKPLSELIKEKALKSLEDEYDARVADVRLEEYENFGFQRESTEMGKSKISKKILGKQYYNFSRMKNML